MILWIDFGLNDGRATDWLEMTDLYAVLAGGATTKEHLFSLISIRYSDNRGWCLDTS